MTNCAMKDADKLPVVVVCEQLLVCLNCGKAEFVVPENKLALLLRGGLVCLLYTASKGLTAAA